MLYQIILNLACPENSEPINLVIMDPSYLSLVQRDVPRFVWEGKYNVAYWAIGLDVISSQCLENMFKIFDEIWCPSHFIKKGIESSTGYDGTSVKILKIPSISQNKEIKTMPTKISNPHRSIN